MNEMNINTIEDKLDRSKVPVPGKPKDINFPAFFEAVTSNGITVIVIEDRKLPLVTARFVFRKGAYFDSCYGENRFGLASITSELLSKGTSSRTATMIADEADFLGATLSTGADFDASYVSCYSLTKHFDSIFEIAKDIIKNPSFTEEELSREREQRLNSLLALIDDGDYLASRAYKSKVFGENPFASPVEGTSKSVSSIQTGDLRALYTNTYTPDNLIVAFVGDISPEEAMNRIELDFGDWRSESKVLQPPPGPVMNKPCVVLTSKSGAVQTSLRLGHVSIKRNDPDFVKVSLMNTILGGYFTSRINKNLREVHGFTYSARSALSSHIFGGDISVITEVKTEITASTIREIFKEIKLLRESAPGDEELQNVKNFVTGNFPLQLETPNSIATKAINLKLFGLSKDYYNIYINTINNLTGEDIHEMAQKYLHPGNMVISAAGNVDQLAKDLVEFGDPEIYEIN
jgi:zinc protease